MKKQILKKIREMEKSHGIRVLFLIESGSRAWGWESKDSDYDVRGVFVQDYVQLDEKTQINYSGDNLDIELWDFKKFLELMSKSNPSVWEWLSSDIVYINNPIRTRLKQIFKDNFSVEALKKHYTSMAKQNFYKYINSAGDKANLKKYVYVLRSIGCVIWLDRMGVPPPKSYLGVVKLLPDKVRYFFEGIVKKKKAASEALEGGRNPTAERFVTSFFNKEFKVEPSKFTAEELNKILKVGVKEL